MNASKRRKSTIVNGIVLNLYYAIYDRRFVGSFDAFKYASIFWIWYYLFLLACVSMCGLCAKVTLLTHSYNRPDFIPLQLRAFEKFLQDEWEFIVFNDGPTQKLADQIEETCKKHHVRCIKIPQEIHQLPYLSRQPWDDWNCPSVRTANAIQYSFDTYALHCDGIVAVIDSDMFLIRPFNIEKYLGDYDIAGVAQFRGSMGVVKYLWNGILFLNMDTLPDKHSLNFNCGSICGNHTDTGGFTHYYIKEHPEAKILYMRQQLDMTDGDFIADSYDPDNRSYFSEREILESVSDSALARLMQKRPDDIQFFLNYAFLHYRRAGNYHNRSQAYHGEKTLVIDQFLQEILDKFPS